MSKRLSRRAVVTLLATAATATAATSAFALGSGIDTGSGGVSVSAGTIGSAALSGECHYAHAGIGIDSSDDTYVLEGAGTAGGVVNGSPIVATGILCTVGTRTTGVQFTPGAASAAAITFNANAVSGAVCTTVYYLTRDNQTGNLPTECH